jgi:hypothetical protein
MIVWESKTPGETVSRRWEPSLDYFENILSAVATVDAGTVTATANVEVFRGDPGATVFIAGGVAGETARISVEVVTSRGRTLVGVFQMGVLAEAPTLGTTASDVCAFALRKVAGNGANPTSDELTDALERLNDMIALWRIQGMDLGIAKVLEASDPLGIPDAFVTSLKFCLRRDLHEFYGVPLSAMEVEQAREAQEAVRAKTMQFQDLTFDRGLLRHPAGWDLTRGF